MNNLIHSLQQMSSTTISGLVLAVIALIAIGITSCNARPYIRIIEEAFLEATDTPTETPTETPTNTVTNTPTNTLTSPTKASATPLPSLIIVHNTYPEPVEAGEILTYNITIVNSGSRDATEVAIFAPPSIYTDFVPGSLSLNPPNAGTVGKSPPLLANGVRIAAGQLITVRYAVTVNKPLTNGTIISNTISLTSAEAPTPSTSLITNTVTTTPRVEISTSGPVTATMGTTANFTFTVTNRGNTVLGVVQIDDDQIGQIYSINESGRNQLNLDETRVYTASYLIVTDTTPLVNTVTITARDALVLTREVITATATHTTNLILPTPTFSPPPPSSTSRPVLNLGLMLRQDKNEQKMLLLTQNDPVTGPFFDYGCLAYGEAFAYSNAKIYHKVLDDQGNYHEARRNSTKEKLVNSLGLDAEKLNFADRNELDNISFNLEFSKNLGNEQNTSSNSYYEGDFWINIVPFEENSSFTITVRLLRHSNQEVIAGPTTFTFETTETSCAPDDGNSPTPKSTACIGPKCPPD